MGGERIKVAGVHEPGGYAHAVRAGNTIYLAGQIGLTPDGKLAGESFEAQAVQVCENIARILAAAGASWADVVKVTAFLTDRAHQPTWREVRKRYFGDAPPASTAVIVAGLVDPRLLIEVEAIAVVG